MSIVPGLVAVALAFVGGYLVGDAFGYRRGEETEAWFGSQRRRPAASDGFTRADVERCRRAARAAEARHDVSGELADYEAENEWNSLADRIDSAVTEREDTKEQGQ
jgi:hypothetical protein